MIDPATLSVLGKVGKGASFLSSLVSPAMDAFFGNPAEKRYLDFLRNQKMTDAELRKRLNQSAGILADSTEMDKNKLMGSMTAKGLENSIIGDQAGMAIDAEANKNLVNIANQLDNEKTARNRELERQIAEFRLNQAGARRQGRADFFGTGLANAGTLLTDWVNKRREPQ